jgi:hypothetical protein
MILNLKKEHLKKIRKLVNKKGKKQKCSCDHEPYLNIEPHHFILDELHLLLRVMDVLINNLIHECTEWDNEDNFNKKKSEQSNNHHSYETTKDNQIMECLLKYWTK